jgi:uncharacterized damage-inducible protein DinB
MPLIDAIVDEMLREGETTKKVLARVPAGRFDWKPHPRARSAGDLAWHVAALPARIAAMAPHDEADVTVVRQAPRPDSPEAIVAAFAEGLEIARAALSGLTDEDLRRKFRFRRGDVTMAYLPKIAFLRGVLLNHSYHHRGQLSVYLRLLDVPVPSIYGPTADEG